MALLEAVIGVPAKFDPATDPLAKPLPQEPDDLRIHVEMCARRYGAIREHMFRVEVAQQGIARILIAVLFVLVASKVIDLDLLAKVL